MSDYDDERPDWREIDRKKDRSGGSTGPREPRKERPTDAWKKGRYKKALDRLFMGEKGTVEYAKLYQKMHGSYGTEKFTANVKAYFEKYGPPDDTPTLILVLDTKDMEIILKVFERFKESFGQLSDRHKADIKRKLSIMALTDRSKEVRAKADELAKELSQAPQATET